MYYHDPERNPNEHTCETTARNYDHRCLKNTFIVLLSIWETFAILSVGFYILQIFLLNDAKKDMRPGDEENLVLLAIIEAIARLIVTLLWIGSLTLTLYGLFSKNFSKLDLGVKMMISCVILFLIVSATFAIIVKNYPFLIGSTVGYSILLVLIMTLGKKNLEAMDRCEICY